MDQHAGLVDVELFRDRAIGAGAEGTLVGIGLR